MCFQEEITWKPENSQGQSFHHVCNLPKFLTSMAVSNDQGLQVNNQGSWNFSHNTDFTTNSIKSSGKAIVSTYDKDLKLISSGGIIKQ